MISSKYIEPSDSCFCLDLWDGSNNILYITGVSGSGKSSLAKDLQKNYNCKLICLDNLSLYYMNKGKKYYDIMESNCPESVIFLNNHPIDNFGVRQTHIDTIDIMKSFCNWFEDKYSNNGELYIIEGYLLHEAFDSKWFNNKPLIIKITDYETVVLRRAGRNHKDDLSLVTERELQIGIKNSKYKESYDSYIEFSKQIKAPLP